MLRLCICLFPVLAALLTACSGPPNSPYPAGQTGQSILYSAFSERPKHLDPARSYSENEYVFIGNIYEPALQYHFLKRPYELEALTLQAMPKVRYLDAQGREVSRGGPVAFSEYELRLKPGMEKAAARHVLPQAPDFGVAELHVTVPRHVKERVVEERRIGEPDLGFRAFDGQRGPLGDRPDEVHQAGRIGVPVAAPFVLQARDGEAPRAGQ